MYKVEYKKGVCSGGLERMSIATGELNSMVIREDELFRILITRLEKVFRIIENTETPYFFVDIYTFTDLEKIGLFLLTKYLSWKLGFSNKNEVSIDWLERQTGLKRNVVISRLKDLKDLNWIEKTDKNTYKVVLSGINKIIERVEKRLE